MKRLFCAAVLIVATGAAGIPLLASAQVGVTFTVGNQPPPPRYERLPPPRAGFVWAPGFWDWDGRRHVWVEGHWEHVQRYREYRPAQWRQGPRGWELDRGGWIDHRDGRDWHDGRHDDYRR